MEFKRKFPELNMHKIEHKIKDSFDITSSKSINLRPFWKSSSIFSIDVPTLRKCELHQAVNV